MEESRKSDRECFHDRSSKNLEAHLNSTPKLPNLPENWRFCRVEAGTKKPVDSGWQESLLTIEQIQPWVDQGGNYGVVWGGRAIGVDVDGIGPHKKLLEIANGREIPATVAWTSDLSGGSGRYHLAFHLSSEQELRLIEAAEESRPTSPQGRWFVSCPEDQKNAQLEFRWRRHQSVLPPSRHPSGRNYEWLPGQSPAEREPAEFPDWLFTYLLSLVRGERDNHAISTAPVIPLGSLKIPLERLLRKEERSWIAWGVAEGTRNDSGAALARNLIGTEAHLQTEKIAFDGNSRSIFDNFCDRCQPPIDPRERESIWLSAEKSKPKPALTPGAIANCVAAWEREQKGDRSSKTQESVKPMAKTEAGESRQTIADLLMEIAEDAVLFHTPDRVAYADVGLTAAARPFLSSTKLSNFGCRISYMVSINELLDQRQ